MSAYLVNRDGQELGSFELHQIKDGLQDGQFRAGDWGWQEGMAEWQSLSKLAGAPAGASAPRPQTALPAPSAAKPAAINPYASPGTQSVGADGSPIVGGRVPQEVVTELAGTKPWIILISVLMWIGCGIMLVALAINLVGALDGATALAKNNMAGAGVGGMLGILFVGVLTALLVLYPTLKLTKFASNIGRLVASQSYADLTNALREQRRFWKFYGILIVIYLGVLFTLAVFAVVLRSSN